MTQLTPEELGTLLIICKQIELSDTATPEFKAGPLAAATQRLHELAQQAAPEEPNYNFIAYPECRLECLCYALDGYGPTEYDPGEPTIFEIRSMKLQVLGYTIPLPYPLTSELGEDVSAAMETGLRQQWEDGADWEDKLDHKPSVG